MAEEHVWLSSMGVWAKKPLLPSSSSVSSEHQEEGDDSCSPKYVHEEEEEEDVEDTRPSCPVCLSSLHDSNLAILRWCMHRFCLDCIQKWSSMKRFCPLCKQTFHGWYHSLRSSSQFREKVLLPPSETVSARFRQHYRRTERQLNSTSFQRSKPLRWRRSFSSFRAPREAEREWRASIYRKGLKAVPPVLKTTIVEQEPATNPGRKSRIEKRLEPWIRRELQAIALDSDPTVLVQFVLSLWFIALEQTERIKEGCESSRNLRQQPSRHLGGVNQVGDTEAVHQLKPFLHEKAATFWHELKCFAESPYSMKAYDSTIAYKKE